MLTRDEYNQRYYISDTLRTGDTTPSGYALPFPSSEIRVTNVDASGDMYVTFDPASAIATADGATQTASGLFGYRYIAADGESVYRVKTSNVNVTQVDPTMADIKFHILVLGA